MDGADTSAKDGEPARNHRRSQPLQVEAGETLADALAEWREAIDFCRFYAAEARAKLGTPSTFRTTGVSNGLTPQPRGVFVAISPWNLPLAIFVGEVAAPLAAANAVVAKPAEQTPLIAAAAIGLMPSTVAYFGWMPSAVQASEFLPRWAGSSRSAAVAMEAAIRGDLR